MTQPSSEEILAFCDAWCAAVTREAGSIAIGGESEKHRLLRNGVQFHELDHASLCASLLGLTRVLLLPGLNTVVDWDHCFLWAWCGEVLLSPMGAPLPMEEHEIQTLYETTIHAALADFRMPPQSQAEWEEQNRLASLQPPHSQALLKASGLVLVYLAFPLLEATVKRACSSFVTLNGEVIARFAVPTPNGVKTYDPKTRQRRCSSLRDLLVLHHTQVATTNLKSFLEQFGAHIKTLDPSQEAYDTIYGWRNQSLHGSASFSTIGGTVLNLTLAIRLFEISSDFENRRARTLSNCLRQESTGSRSPWSFYPPF